MLFNGIKPTILLVATLALLITLGCDRDDTSATLTDDDIELDIQTKGIELESTSYAEKDLPEIWSSSDLTPGKYKMRVGEAYVCRDKYI